MQIKAAEVRKGLQVSMPRSHGRQYRVSRQLLPARRELGSAVLCAGRRAGERSGTPVPGW